MSEFFGGGCMILIIMWRIVMDTLPDQGIKLLCQLLCLVLSSNCLTPAAPTFYCLIKTGVDLYKHQQCTYAIPDSTDVEKTSCHHHCIIKSLWKRVTHGVAGECIWPGMTCHCMACRHTRRQQLPIGCWRHLHPHTPHAIHSLLQETELAQHDRLHQHNGRHCHHGGPSCSRSLPRSHAHTGMLSGHLSLTSATYSYTMCTCHGRAAVVNHLPRPPHTRHRQDAQRPVYPYRSIG